MKLLVSCRTGCRGRLSDLFSDQIQGRHESQCYLGILLDPIWCRIIILAYTAPSVLNPSKVSELRAPNFESFKPS